jgi:hypothetical protein
MKTRIKTIYSFDFDDTLFFSPRPEEGKDIFKSKTGLDWPYHGWWSKAETLDTDIFYVPINPWVLSKYKETLQDEESIRILATGRLEKVPKMRQNVEKLIKEYDLDFHSIHLNTMGDTFMFKTKLFTSLIKETKCDKFVMYDDRHEHLVKFEDWAILQPCDVDIIDVKNKTLKSF